MGKGNERLNDALKEAQERQRRWVDETNIEIARHALENQKYIQLVNRIAQLEDLLKKAESIIDKSDGVIRLQSEIISKYEKHLSYLRLPWYKKLFK